MKHFKKKLLMLLCMLLVVPTMTVSMPWNLMQAEAASTTTYLTVLDLSGTYDSKSGCNVYKVNVEKGQSVPVGDMAVTYSRYNSTYVYSSYYRTLSKVSNTKYTSSNKTVASISSKGVLTTKKVGTTDVKVTLGSNSAIFRFNVVKAGKLGTTSSKYSSLRSKVKTMMKAYGTGISSTNCIKASNALHDLDIEFAKQYSKSGSKLSSWRPGYGEAKDGTANLIVPEMLRHHEVDYAINYYAMNNNPTDVDNSKGLKIAKVTGSAKKNTITITLKSKVTAAQIFCIRKTYENDTYLINDKKATMTMYVIDKKTGQTYQGKATLKQGSKLITLKLDYKKLVSGTKYQLTGMKNHFNGYSESDYWTKGKTFTAGK